MPHRFCAICGKNLKEDSPHFGMCMSCFLKENPLFELPTKLNIKICPDCWSFSRREEWFQTDTDNLLSIIKQAIFRFILNNYLKMDKIFFLIDFDKDSFTYSSKNLLSSLETKIRGELKEDKKVWNEKKMNININYDLCQNCLNIRGGNYYQSILQLRVVNENYFGMLKQVLDILQKYVETLFEDDKRQYISKIIDQKYGLDLYLSTNELLNHIISYLRNNYHFLLIRTKKLVGRNIQIGKNLYRLKALVKFFPFKKNDRIEIENHKYTVEKITKNRVILRGEDNSKMVKNFSYFLNENTLVKNIKKEIYDEKK